MGFISDAIGGVEDIFGARNKFQAQPGATTGQIGQAYQTGQDIYGRQTSVADQLAARAGTANPLDFSAANKTLGTGNDLLTSLINQGNGVGPNPALEQLHQTTSQNVNNAAGMAASARGVNPALAARMAVNAAGGANQTAAGQAAVMTAQQQLAARQLAAGLVGQQAGQQANLAQAQFGAQHANIQQLIQQLAQMQTGNINQQSILQTALMGQNQINAGVASQNASFGQKLLGGAIQGASAAMGAGGAGGGAGGMSPTAIDAAAVDGGYSPVQMMGSGVATGGEITQTGVRRPTGDKAVAAAILGKNKKPAAVQPAQGQKKQLSDKDVARAILFGKGGKVPKKADAPKGNGSPDKAAAAQIVMQRYFGGGRAGYAAGGPVRAPMPAPMQPPPMLAAPSAAPNGPASHIGQLLRGFARGGKVDVILSPGEVVMPPGSSPRDAARMVASGGGRVPGRAAVAGDSTRNDTVPDELAPGSIVIPRSASGSPEKAQSFVQHLVKTRKPARGFHRVVEARKRAEAR